VLKRALKVNAISIITIIIIVIDEYHCDLYILVHLNIKSNFYQKSRDYTYFDSIWHGVENFKMINVITSSEHSEKSAVE
jgi:hypothetical protein